MVPEAGERDLEAGATDDDALPLSRGRTWSAQHHWRFARQRPEQAAHRRHRRTNAVDTDAAAAMLELRKQARVLKQAVFEHRDGASASRRWRTAWATG